MSRVKTFFMAVCICVFSLVGIGSADAAWPEKPIQFIVPYAAGGGADVAARIITAQLSKELGVPVPVVNVPGVSATLGMNQVIEAKPDGYTIGTFHEGSQATYVAGIGKYSLADLDVLCNVNQYPNLIVTRADAPWKDLAALIEVAKKKEGEVKAAAVLGSASYFFVLDFMDTAGVTFKIVPYNGHAERVNATLGGFADFTESAPATVASMIRAKKLRPLAMFTEQRDPLYPNIPTATEQGVPVTFVSHYALCVPKGTPADIAQKLEAAMRKAIAHPDVVKKLQDAGSPVEFMPKDKITALMDKALARYQELGKKYRLPAKK